MTFPKEFKEAIRNLPSAEKDKLIFKLLKNDMNLVNRLYFELVDPETVEEKRAKMQREITKRLTKMNQPFYCLYYLQLDMDYLSGTIKDHVRITKDKFGEIVLNIQMLNEVLASKKASLEKAKPTHVYKLNIYIIARAFKILLKIKALDKDYLIEFKDGLNKLGQHISENHLLFTTAINHGLDINYLLEAKIPSNIVSIHKDLRSNGFLK